jgi:hypothetical protein
MQASSLAGSSRDPSGPLSGEARALRPTYNASVSSFAAKEDQVKLRLHSEGKQDDRVVRMLDLHVRGQRGSAPIVLQKQDLRRRLKSAA